MELIIKIPDEVYKTVQDGSYCGSLYEELKAAIPYNPTGDCISREDLKEEVVGMMINKADDLEEVEFEINATLASVCEKINNATTVEPRIEYDKYGKPYKLSITNGKEYDRPQGEWIYHDKLNMYFCKDCGLLEPFTKEEIEEGIKLPNFCQQCGADMRGGAYNEETDK